MSIKSFFHHLFNPHCQICSKCESCETLRLQLDIANRNNRELVETIVAITTPREIVIPNEVPNSLQAVPRSLGRRHRMRMERQRVIEREFKESAKAGIAGIEELEKKLGIEDEINRA